MNDKNESLTRTEEDQKRATQMHDSYRLELLKRQLSNTENYDKAILTLSSSGLAISISFVNFIKDISSAKATFLMSASWGFFTLSIVLSLIAYYVSNKAIDRQLEIAEDYYFKGELEAINQKNKFSSYNEVLNFLCGILFILGILCVSTFVVINVHKGDAFMSDKNSTSVSTVASDSAIIPSMQRVNMSELAVNSANIPRMQAAPATSTPVSASQQSSSSSSSVSSSES